MVSTATRLRGSCASMASRIESLIWSAILSGWPSVTDSDVKRRRGTRHSLTWWSSRRTVRSTARAERYRLGRTRWCPPDRSSWGDVRKARCDGRPDPRRDGVLGPARHLGGRPVGPEHHVAVVVPGLGGEADDQLAGPAGAHELGQDFGIAHQDHRVRLARRALLQL